MPRAKNVNTEAGAVGTVWVAECSVCGWSVVRKYEDEAQAAAATHAVQHEPMPATRPTW